MTTARKGTLPNALAVMARYPRAGDVKTRLAKVLGEQGACDLYAAFLRDLESRFRRGSRQLVWCYTPADADFASLFVEPGLYLSQSGNELGARMRNVFATLHKQGFVRVVMIGADVPHIESTLLDEADEKLADHDVVLGPSRDGGYYLIAMKEPHDVFSGIEMSTPHVLTATLARCAALGLRAALLPPSFDIDEIEDLEELRRVIADGRVDLRHTAGVFRAPSSAS